MDSTSHPTTTTVVSRGEEPWLRPELAAPWRELIPVIAIVIGFSTLMSSLQAIFGSSHTFISDVLTDERLIRTLTTECGLLGLLFVHLNWRGWRAADFRIKPGWLASAQGLLLIPAMMVANSLTVLIGFLALYFFTGHGQPFIAFLQANSPQMMHLHIHVSWLAIIAAMVFNGFFEEITTMGYAFNQLAAKWGPAPALICVVILRMSCHSYQGWVHMLGIGAVFLTSGMFYCWTRNLWPIILAHILVDLASVSAIKVFFSA